ncbi:MAG: sensor histidine kinase [Jeotgalicoccus sp.]
MWGWLFIFLILALLFYIFFLKIELRKLKNKLKTMPVHSGFGSRLSVDFRQKETLDLVEELNKMIDVYEDKNRQSKKMEDNVKLSIAGISHDLRTPLTSINGYVQLLRKTDDIEKRQQYLNVIERSVNRLIEMTDSFYDLARIETNQKEMELTSIALPALVEETFLSFYEQFEVNHLEVVFPEYSKSDEIIADQLITVRVVQNIIQNILRYADSTAIISYSMQDNYLKFSVKNDVKTDSKIAIEKVFSRFYTEDVSRTNVEASGLGLYMSKKLVEKMDGKMNAEMNGKWFTVNIYLPINRGKTA